MSIVYTITALVAVRIPRAIIVWEWTRSAFEPYPYDPTDGREDEVELVRKRFTLRGGSWINQSRSLRAAYRFGSAPDYFNNYIGFRIARHPQQH